MLAVEELRALLTIRSVEKQMLRLQWLAAATRFEIAMCRHDRALKRACKAGFNPDQPRVPAGNPDGGKWTGSGRGQARTRVAANDRRKFDPIRLEDEELNGGHTVEFHVGRSEEALKAQALAAFDSNPNAENSRSGSFSSLAAANKLVNSTLAQNQATVEEVANGTFARRVVISQFDSITGTEAVAPSLRSAPYIRETYGVGVVIVHDPYASRGFRVLTAFPTNRQSP